MKLYALCWQDETEPWGWAPMTDPESRCPQVFFWDRAKADAALVKYVAEVPTGYGGAWSIQEYDVPDPPLRTMRALARRTEFRCTGCGLTSDVSRPDHTHGGQSRWQAIPVEG